MTKEEFTREYDRLQNEFPKKFDSPERKRLLGRAVGLLPHKWLQKHVDSMIADNKSGFDLEGQARIELRGVNASKRTKEFLTAETKRLEENKSEGLDKILKQMGASSILDALEKSKTNTG